MEEVSPELTMERRSLPTPKWHVKYKFEARSASS